ncbi:hypothetical protein [Hoeflea phototrophica]|uniref:hypothetical protein n=1 Tax=Hoeflea phototrophica TaxID=244596 RepID=UPI0012EB3DF5|nr:hypothetical protein [Hoeflea phototrophica]
MQHEPKISLLNFSGMVVFFRSDFGGAHRIVSNPYRYKASDVTFPEWLKDDAGLIQEALAIGFFHYGPPLWRIGEIEPLIQLRNSATRESAAKIIVQKYPSEVIYEDFEFYRLRTKLSDGMELDYGQYDAPPDGNPPSK